MRPLDVSTAPLLSSALPVQVPLVLLLDKFRLLEAHTLSGTSQAVHVSRHPV
jgi:hypothetical protein